MIGHAADHAAEGFKLKQKLSNAQMRVEIDASQLAVRAQDDGHKFPSTSPQFTSSGAIFDLSRRYRYLLWRAWDESRPTVTFIMLNPSSADAERLDPTIRRCISFSLSWGFGRLLVVNLYGYRTPDSRSLAQVADPVGPYNEDFVRLARDCSDRVVVAWGNHGAVTGRDMAQLNDWCLGLTTLGNPKHPLYVPGTIQPAPI